MPCSSVHFIIGILNVWNSEHKFLCLQFCWEIWLMHCAFHIWIKAHLGLKSACCSSARDWVYLMRKATNTPAQLQYHHPQAEDSFSRKAISSFCPGWWRSQQHPMYMTESANHFKVIKQTVAALIWSFISSLLWDVAGSRYCAAKLFFCGAITSLPIWSTPSLHAELCLGGSEAGLVKKGAWKRWEP